MADWNLPTTGDTYSNFLTYLANRLVDAGTMFVNAPTNQPTGAIRYNRSTNLFEEWGGAAWVAKTLSVAGGGTGGTTTATARTALGLGTMAVQDSNAVTITGGSVSGITLDASTLTSGTVPLARGGTGASLALGATGNVLVSNGVSVIFGDGSTIPALNASNLTSGTVPVARLSGITTTQMASANISQFTNDSQYLVYTGTITGPGRVRVPGSSAAAPGLYGTGYVTGARTDQGLFCDSDLIGFSIRNSAVITCSYSSVLFPDGPQIALTGGLSISNDVGISLAAGLTDSSAINQAAFLIRVSTNAGASSLNGLWSSSISFTMVDGRFFMLFNAGPNNLTLNHSVAPAVGKKFVCKGGTNFVMGLYQVALCYYDDGIDAIIVVQG